jgi:hypothetical protein
VELSLNNAEAETNTKNVNSRITLGCENNIAQPSPIHPWKLIVPCEVSAVKLGASSFMRNIFVS